MAFKVRTKPSTIYTLDFKGSKISYRPLTNEENIKIQDTHTTKTSKRRADGKWIFDETPNWNNIFIDKFKKMILGWDFVDEDGNPLLCNDETKAEFINLNTSMAVAISTEIEEIEKEGVKVEEKNY